MMTDEQKAITMRAAINRGRHIAKELRPGRVLNTSADELTDQVADSFRPGSLDLEAKIIIDGLTRGFLAELAMLHQCVAHLKEDRE